MNKERKVELIKQTLNHKAGKEMRMNTVWVGSLATAQVCDLLCIRLGHDSIDEALDKELAHPHGWRVIDKVFYYLIRYMVDMGVIK